MIATTGFDPRFRARPTPSPVASMPLPGSPQYVDLFNQYRQWVMQQQTAQAAWGQQLMAQQQHDERFAAQSPDNWSGGQSAIDLMSRASRPQVGPQPQILDMGTWWQQQQGPRPDPNASSLLFNTKRDTPPSGGGGGPAAGGGGSTPGLARPTSPFGNQAFNTMGRQGGSYPSFGNPGSRQTRYPGAR